MHPERIRTFLQEQGEPAYRAQQAIDAICSGRVLSFDDLTTWSKGLREKAAAELPLMSLKEKKILASSSKVAFKALVELADGNSVETVLMSPKPGLWTTCISSQVGCAMACTFCATGKLGLMRNLTAEEITDQVLFWMQYMHVHNMEGRLNNIVYMGMGEPMANLTNVEESLQLLTDPKVFNFGDRHISVSTSGLVPGILRLGKNWPQVNLALSLHVANDIERTAMMPVNKSFNIAKLQAALKEYFTLTNRKVFLEYILLRGENDTPRHAQQLIDFIEGIGKPHLLHVNLIVYNKTGAKYEETPREQSRGFADRLRKAGIHATIRKNLGRDISGACGQLAGEK
ncbi:MAG: 23S rRNA (adenine(2503)-C(2))-methyltransferase RlmN [Candidatus Kerfeldbacteria bacterium]|nr:23S rRNA (adenine(2503)-C(2))-methyltransferase RlmN [Candidatus Kerfeldbacteria bacterium]